MTFTSSRKEQIDDITTNTQQPQRPVQQEPKETNLCHQQLAAETKGSHHSTPHPAHVGFRRRPAEIGTFAISCCQTKMMPQKGECLTQPNTVCLSAQPVGSATSVAQRSLSSLLVNIKSRPPSHSLCEYLSLLLGVRQGHFDKVAGWGPMALGSEPFRKHLQQTENSHTHSVSCAKQTPTINSYCIKTCSVLHLPSLSVNFIMVIRN